MFDCPITALGGKEDNQASIEEIMAWSQHTYNSFKMLIFPGDHFFIKNSQKSVLDFIFQTLLQHL
jgi:medium-chain acyl-[acyl-carrier-protein] hydrolase